MTLRPVYKLIIYAEDDTTVLTPAAGAPHSLPFLVATRTGISDGNGDYLGVLDTPEVISGGPLDVIANKVETGSRTYRILDTKYPTPGQGDTEERFASAYFGDARGLERYKGLKCVEWRSLDYGVSFGSDPSFTGRINASKLDGNIVELGAKDTSEALNAADVFLAAPHADINYVARECLWPPGLTEDYGPFKAAIPFTGRMDAAGVRQLNVEKSAYSNPSNFISSSLRAYLFPEGVIPGHNDVGVLTSTLRARVTQTSGGSSGTTADYQVDYVRRVARGDGHWSIIAVMLLPLAGGTAVPAANVTVTVTIFAEDRRPIFIGDVHRVTFWRHLLEGKFGRLNADGSVVRSYPYDAAAFTAMEADPTFGTVRLPVFEKAKLSEAIVEIVLQPGGLGYDLNGDGETVPVDIRLPASLSGLTEIDDDDMAGVPVFGSEASSAPGVLEHSFYHERLAVPPDLPRVSVEYPDIQPGRIVTTEHRIVVPNVARPALGDRTIKIKGTGERCADGENSNGRTRRDYLEGQVGGRLEDLLTQFAAGALEVDLSLKWSVAAGLTRGQWILLTSVHLPNPALNRRGGQRLVQVTELRPASTFVEVKVCDAGKSPVALVPTIGTLALETDNERHGIIVPVTLNASDQAVRLRVAVTGTGVGTAPLDDSELWVFAARPTADGNVNLRGFPSDSRVWVQGRSEPNDGFQMPSAWVDAGSIDTDAVPAPTGLTATVDGRDVLLEWTNGVADLPVQVLYCTPSGGTPLLVMTLPAGTIRWPMGIIAASTSHKAQVRHPDGHGGASATDEETFNTTTGGFTVPAAPGVGVLIGRFVGTA